MSSLIEFLSDVVRFFSELLSRRREDRERLWERISDVRSRLVLALEEGRVSDVPALRSELASLLKQYSKYVKNSEVLP